MRQNHEWTLWLAEREAHFNAATDRRVFGKPFSHPFLVFKTPSGEVLGEIHGTWAKKRSTYPVAYLINRFTSAARSETFAGRVEAVSAPVFPRTIIKIHSGVRNDRNAVHRQIVFSGALSEAREIWGAVRGSFDDLNRLRLPFYQYATPFSGFGNCQRLLRLALESANALDTIPDLRLAQTGWTVPSKTDIKLGL